jgi:hypothetical protein
MGIPSGMRRVALVVCRSQPNAAAGWPLLMASDANGVHRSRRRRLSSNIGPQNDTSALRPFGEAAKNAALNAK